MEQNEGIEGIRNDLDDRVVGHEKGVCVKRLAVIIFEQLKIAQKVNDQK